MFVTTRAVNALMWRLGRGVAAIVAIFIPAGPAPALAHSRPALTPELEALRAKLEPYQDPYKAVHDGYLSTLGCVEFPDGGMDGMRCDAEGNLYVTRYEMGKIVKVSPGGEVLAEVKLKGKKPSNIAFGGPDGKTCYVTLQDRGNIEWFRTDVPDQGDLVQACHSILLPRCLSGSLKRRGRRVS